MNDQTGSRSLLRNRRAVVIGVTAVVFIIAGYAGLAGYQLWAYYDFENTYAPPGQLVDVNGTEIHLFCSGSGTPTTILEAGAGSWSLDWHLVQSRLSNDVRVCSYDRAGIGWSDESPEPRDINSLVLELDALLNSAQLEPPFVMVGASFGGMIVQLYEQRHPDLVSAVVLIDGRPGDYFQRYEEIVPKAQDRLLSEMGTVLTLHKIGLLAAVVNVKPPKGTPEEFVEIYQHPGRMTKHAVATARERVEGQDNERHARTIDAIGSKPLLVVSHGKPGMFEGRAGVSTEQATALEELFGRLQLELAGLSSTSRHVVAERSGHTIQFDQPDLVADEILQLIENSVR